MSGGRAERGGGVSGWPSIVMTVGLTLPLAMSLTGCSTPEIRSALRNPLRMRNHDADLAAIAAPSRNPSSGDAPAAPAALRSDDRARALAVAKEGALRDAASGRGANAGVSANPASNADAASRPNSGFFARFLRPGWGFGRSKSNDPPLGVFGFRQTPSFDLMRSNGLPNLSRENAARPFGPRSGLETAARSAPSQPSSSSSSLSLSQSKPSRRPSPAAELAMSNASRFHAGQSLSSARASSTTISDARAQRHRSKEIPKEPNLGDAADMNIPALPVTLTLRPYSDSNPEAEADDDASALPAAHSRIAMTSAKTRDGSVPSLPPANVERAKPARSVIQASSFSASPQIQPANPDSPPVPDPDASSLEEAADRRPGLGSGLGGLWDRWLKKDRSS